MSKHEDGRVRRDRERTRAVIAYVGAHKEELLKQIPEGKGFKDRFGKRNEVLRLGRIKFNDLPQEEQARYFVPEPKTPASQQKKGKGYGSKAVPKTPSPPNAAPGVSVKKSSKMMTPSRASKSHEGVRVPQPPQGVQTSTVFKKGHPASGSQGVPAASGSQGVPAASGSQASDMGDIERTIASFNSLFVKTFGLAQGTSIMSAAYSFADFANKAGWRNRVPVQVSAAAVATLAAKLNGKEIQAHQIRTLWRIIAAPYDKVDVQVEERRLFGLWAMAPMT